MTFLESILESSLFFFNRKKAHFSLPLFPLQKAIDPLTGQELGGLIKVYHTDGAYKTIPATSSMSAADICLIMCKNLNISEGQEVFLFVCLIFYFFFFFHF